MGPGLQSARAQGQTPASCTPDPGCLLTTARPFCKLRPQPCAAGSGIPGRRDRAWPSGALALPGRPLGARVCDRPQGCAGRPKGRAWCRILPVAPPWSGTRPEQRRYLRSRQSRCGSGHHRPATWAAPSNSQLHKTQRPRRFIGDPGFLCVGLGRARSCTRARRVFPFRGVTSALSCCGDRPARGRHGRCTPHRCTETSVLLLPLLRTD